MTKGAFRVPARPTAHSLATPLTMATSELRVLISPKVRPRSPPLSASLRAWKSETIHVSKTVKSRLVATPPRTRPANSSGTLGTHVSAHEAA
jgi:hypothetical protein